MLNYLWAGMIILSLAFALGHDLADIFADRYGNGQMLPVTVEEDEKALAVRILDQSDQDVLITEAQQEGESLTIHIEPADYAAMFGVKLDAPLTLSAVRDEKKGTLQLSGDLPEPLATMATHLDPDEGVLTATLTADGAGLTFPPVRFVKMTAIQRAAFDMADWAAKFAIGLTGLLALWLGLVKIGEAAGMIAGLVKLVRPVLGWIFPKIPKDHPALGLIALNLTANVLGMGNAATPLGLKAMESLQTLNPSDDTATDPMVMFLAINTASVMLVPSVTVVAIMGLEAGALTLPIIAVTLASLIIAIVACRWLSRLKIYRRSDPNANEPHGNADVDANKEGA